MEWLAQGHTVGSSEWEFQSVFLSFHSKIIWLTRKLQKLYTPKLHLPFTQIPQMITSCINTARFKNRKLTLTTILWSNYWDFTDCPFSGPESNPRWCITFSSPYSSLIWSSSFTFLRCSWPWQLEEVKKLVTFCSLGFVSSFPVIKNRFCFLGGGSQKPCLVSLSASHHGRLFPYWWCKLDHLGLDSKASFLLTVPCYQQSDFYILYSSCQNWSCR